MSIGTREIMRNTTPLEKGIEFLIFTSPIGLDIQIFFYQTTSLQDFETLEIFETLQICALVNRSI
jgi:hypothetical protein